MHANRICQPRPWQRKPYATDSKPGQPPQPRPYRSLDPAERKPLTPAEPWEAPQPKKRTLTQRLFGLRDHPSSVSNEPKDIARGFEAAQRAVQTGILDPRYRPAAWQVTKLLCGLPVVIVLGYHLVGRGLGWEEQKKHTYQMPEETSSAT